MRRRLLLTTIALTSLALAAPALAQDKPFAGQSITVLMPSPQAPNIAADFEAETGIKVDLQTLSWDDIRPKLVAALIAIPNKIFALLMVASFGSSVPLLLLMAAFAYMPGSFRIARAVAVNVMTMDFVRVARTRGEAMPYIIFIEVLPNMLRPVMTDFGLRFVYVVLLLSAMSFLGLGVQPPDADWGSLVRENIQGLAEGAPAVLAPAVAIATLTMGVNLLIDSFGGRSKREMEK